MDMGMDMDKIMEQAQAMQQKMQDVQSELNGLKIIGESGDKHVRVLMTGMRNLLSTKISPDLIDQGVNAIELRVTEAVNNAMKKIEGETEGKMRVLTEGMDLPEGFEMPKMGGNITDQQGG